MVQGISHTNLIFDVVVPHNFELSDQVLREKIQKLVSGEKTRYYTVVTVDHSYAPFHTDGAGI